MNNSLIIGKVAIELDSVDSTNRYASDMLSSKTKPFEGTVILAREQTAGRGQFGAKWSSPAKSNLYMSLILYPTFLAAANQFLLSQAISLGILDTIRTYGEKDFYVKWPNDLFYRDSKLGGVLIENTLRGNALGTSIIGIGLNLNSAPPDVPRAAALASAFGGSIDVEAFQEALYSGLERRYLQLRSGQYAKLRAAYQAGLYGLKTIKRYRANNAQFPGTVVGVTNDGQLELLVDGQLRRFNFKEVELLTG